MPDPKFLKPWHSIPREAIKWNPTVDADACIGCGTCVTGCSRLVYRYDYDERKAVVVDPLNCMVGCTTCANTCPANAIHFPSLSTIFELEARTNVHHAIEDDLVSRKDQLAYQGNVPHPDRILNMIVAKKEIVNSKTLLLKLIPAEACECLSQFMPGQYVEIIPPTGGWLPRAYSIGNAPNPDGSIELQIRYVENGRVSTWLFDALKEKDMIQIRGPKGGFTMKSLPDRPLLFVAGGTGFAPIKALIEQQMQLNKERKMTIYWGIGSLQDLYDAEELSTWIKAAPNLRITIAVDRGNLTETPEGIKAVAGRLSDAIEQLDTDFQQEDAYVAGPPAMMPGIVKTITDKGIHPDRIHVDSFGL